MAVAWVIGYFLPQMVISGISSFLSAEGNPALQTFFVVLASLIGIVLAPILPCALTLLYYDLRVRREAFDLQILSEQLGPR
jgi:Na+/serine symporter